MSCAKRTKEGHCSHFQCPYSDRTDHGYECVSLLAGQTSQICEVGENCVKECPFSFTSDDPEAQAAVNAALAEFDSEMYFKHGGASAEEIARAQEAEQYDRDLDQHIRESEDLEQQAKMEYYGAKNALELAQKERQEMEAENIVNTFISEHPVAMLHGVMDFLFNTLEKDDKLPDGVTIENLENVYHNLGALIESVKEDA